MASFFLTASGQQDSLTIKGKLKGQGSNKVYMSFVGEDGKNKSYTAVAVKDAFSFKVKKQSTPTVVRFSSAVQKSMSKTINGTTYSNPAPALEFFVSASDLTIIGVADDLQLAIVKGDKENNAYSSFKKSIQKDEKKEWDVRQKTFYMEDKDSVARKKLTDAVFANSRKKWNIQKKYISENPASFGSLFMLSRMENLYTTGAYEEAFNGLADDYKQTAMAQKIAKRIEFLSPTSPGKPAVQFVRNDKDGNEINLANYKGKVVLLDFWGSWCSPCRASHPHLKELYAKYKDKGFEIIAIAAEQAKTPEEQKAKWLEAIEKDGINWVHILNNDGKEKQDIVKDYRVSAFPTKILLDKDGKILLRITASATDDIDKMLEKKLGN